MKCLLTTTDKQGTKRVLISEIEDNKYLKVIEMVKPNTPISYIFTHISEEDLKRELALGFYTNITNNIEEVEGHESEILTTFNQNFHKYLIDF